MYFSFSVVAPVQQRFSSNGYVEDVGPPASFNHIPHPEGDWTENHAKKPKKYNMVLGGAAAFFVGTVLFVRNHWK